MHTFVVSTQAQQDEGCWERAVYSHACNTEHIRVTATDKAPADVENKHLTCWVCQLNVRHVIVIMQLGTQHRTSMTTSIKSATHASLMVYSKRLH